MYYIYLDDLRDPKTDHDWQVCRSVNEFMYRISTWKLWLHRGKMVCLFMNILHAFGFNHYEKLYISLDHDLGEGIPTGYDAIKQLVEYLIENSISKDFIVSNITINVHSANPVGKANIEGYWNSFIRSLNA